MTTERITAEAVEPDAEDKETLYRHQLDVRRSAIGLRELLVSTGKAEEKDKERETNIGEMIEFECETWVILKEVTAQAKRLGYKE